MEIMNECKKCGTPHDSGRRICRECEASSARNWRAKNPDRARQIIREYQERNPEKMRAHNRRMKLRKAYGVTPEQFEAMLTSQSGRCAICGTSAPNGPGKRFMVDHSHKTGKVRGLLCCNCNFVIGHCLENIETLKKAVTYLEEKSLVC